MPPRNRTKLGITIPVDPRSKGFDALTSPSNSSSAAVAAPSTQPSPTRRNAVRSHWPQTSTRAIPQPSPVPIRRTHQVATKRAVTAETTKLEKEETEELEKLVHAPPFGKGNKKISKQLSLCETRDNAWEKRRMEIFRQEKRRNSVSVVATNLTPDMGHPQELKDADLHELKGSIELGFGFKEEDGQNLCNTLPALDLYFAVNRKLSQSPVSTPRLTQTTSLDSPRSEDIWMICGRGDDPQQVKTKLRHWAQAVACSIMQTH